MMHLLIIEVVPNRIKSVARQLYYAVLHTSIVLLLFTKFIPVFVFKLTVRVER